MKERTNKIMSVASYENTKKELIEIIRATSGTGDRQFDIAKAILDVKLQENIAKQTGKLTFATWGLVIATAGLIFATISPYVIRAIQTLLH